MLFDINSIVEGKYYPGTFILGIDKAFYEGIEYSSFSNDEMATFAHEYVHYLQDISTLQGVMLFQHRAKLLQLNISIAQNEPNICIPINLEKCGIPNAYAQTELLSFFEGGQLEKKIHHINKVQVENEELLDEILETHSNYTGEKIPQISIYYNDEDCPTVFGANYILESMAYLIERYCFDAEERINEFPYNACEMICKQVYPELLVHPECLVAICELALMYEHSGLQFYLILKHLKNASNDFSNIHNLKLYLNNTMQKLVEKQVIANELLVDNINFMFPPQVPYLKTPNVYIRTMFEAGYKWRKHNLFFISDIFSDENPIDKIKIWMDLFPTPMFIDGINKEFYGAIDSLSMIPVPFSILEYFSNPNNGCPLIEYCIYSRISNIDINICKSKPWQQCKKTKLCPLALYFTAYRLDDKTFNIIE